MGLRLDIAPTTYPITLAEAKLHLRVDHDEEDAYITALITAATEQAEQRTGRALMPQAWLLTLDYFPAEIELTRLPVQTIVSVEYITPLGATLALAPGTHYRLSDADDYGFAKLVCVAGQTWPSTLADRDVVTVRYTAGYASAAAVPESIKQWIKLAIGDMYENRTASDRPIGTANPSASVPHSFVDRLLDRYRVAAL